MKKFFGNINKIEVRVRTKKWCIKFGKKRSKGGKFHWPYIHLYDTTVITLPPDPQELVRCPELEL